MPKEKFAYSEDILQWIWKNTLFDTSELRTNEGKLVKIFDPGTLNISDGPDFLNAKLSVDGLTWHGAVEIHLKSSGWKQHGHHLDDAYNKVILHVVVDNFAKNVHTFGAEELPTLNLLPYLPKQLSTIISEFDQVDRLPCSSTVHFISEEAFETQIDIAHKEYLEKKGNDFLSFYNPEILPSNAWKQALVLSLFDGFGIIHNREPMQKVGVWFLNEADKSSEALTQDALNFAGFGNSPSLLKWNHKGVYPANHPQKRIIEAIRLAKLIMETPFETFLEINVLKEWNNWLKQAELEGYGKLKILYGTVYLPAIYVLGNLFSVKKLSRLASNEWGNYRVPIPKSILKPFQSLQGINHKSYVKKLGMVHQLNAYCNSRRCHECIVLKKVILS